MSTSPEENKPDPRERHGFLEFWNIILGKETIPRVLEIFLGKQKKINLGKLVDSSSELRVKYAVHPFTYVYNKQT